MLGLELVLEYLQLHPILRYLRLLLIQGTSQFSHLILDPLLVGLEEANFLRIELVVLPLLLDSICPSVKCLFLHVKPLNLLLKLIVQVHDLSLFFVKLSLALLELPFLHNQVSALVLSLFKLFPEFNLSLIHLFSEILTTCLDLF